MEEESSEFRSRSLFQEIQDMTVSEKLDFARKGSKEARTILIRDSNKLVQLAVISSPKITETEILMIANNRQVNDEVLRTIANNREWMKNYQVKSALLYNPKTPVQIALKLVPMLSQKDLGLLAKSKSVARVLTIAASRRLKDAKH